MTYVLIVVVVGGGYLGFVYFPYYLDHYAAKTKCEKTLNETWRHKDENKTAQTLRRALAKVATKTVFDGAEEKQVPAINPEDQDLQITIDRTRDPPVLMATVDYERTIIFPLIKKTKPKWFHLECELSLEEVIW